MRIPQMTDDQLREEILHSIAGCPICQEPVQRTDKEVFRCRECGLTFGITFRGNWQRWARDFLRTYRVSWPQEQN